MKENKKLISEILADVRHDMTDEEILNLLASSRVSVNPEKESGKLTSLGQRAADSIAKICRKLGVYLFLYRCSDPLDGGQHGAGCQSV